MAQFSLLITNYKADMFVHKSVDKNWLSPSVIYCRGPLMPPGTTFMMMIRNGSVAAILAFVNIDLLILCMYVSLRNSGVLWQVYWVLSN